MLLEHDMPCCRGHSPNGHGSLSRTGATDQTDASRIGRSGRLKAAIVTPAAAAMAASKRKNVGLSMPLHRLPSQPAKKLPKKLVASHAPIIIDRMRAGAIFETSERPIGDR